MTASGMWKRSDAVGDVQDFEPELDVTDLSSLFGPIDIYLFDQILRGRITPGMTVFDAATSSFFSERATKSSPSIPLRPPSRRCGR